MGKKKRIREQFNAIFKSGDQKQIKQMLKQNPWLLSELSEEMSRDIEEQHQILAATGVMEDELGRPVNPSEIILSLKTDFDIQKTKQDLKSILIDLENLGLIEKKDTKWHLTGEGEILCDEFLNKILKNIDTY